MRVNRFRSSGTCESKLSDDIRAALKTVSHADRDMTLRHSGRTGGRPSARRPGLIGGNRIAETSNSRRRWAVVERFIRENLLCD